MWTFNQRKNDKVSVGSFACLRNDPAFRIISVGKCEMKSIFQV